MRVMRNEIKLKSYLDTDEDGGTWVRLDLMIDGEPYVDSRRHALDLQPLVSSQYSPGEYFIFTCSCGHAGCAGIWKGVKVWHDDVSVQRAVHSFSPTETFRFERTAYSRAIDQGLKALRGWFTAYPEIFNRERSGFLMRYFPDLWLLPQPTRQSARPKKKKWR